MYLCLLTSLLILIQYSFLLLLLCLSLEHQPPMKWHDSDWQSVWTFWTLSPGLGFSLGRPPFFFLLTLKQRPYAILWTKPPRPVGQGHRWQGWRPHLASCAIGWWSVTSRLIERWLKSILCLAHREIMADKITTVLQEGNCTGHILQELSQGRKSGF